MRDTPAIIFSAVLRAPYTVTIAARPVRSMRASGSVRKVVWSHTPERTRGSASSRITAETPPTKSAIGLRKICQATPSGDESAASPTGVRKSTTMPVTGRSAARASTFWTVCWRTDSLIWKLREEREQGGVRRLGLLLLVPVPGALDQDLAAQIRAEGRQHGDGGALRLQLGTHHDGVAQTADEERGHRDLAIREGGEQLPVAIEVPVPVEAAAEAGALELARVDVEVGFREPVGQLLRVEHAVHELRRLRQVEFPRLARRERAGRGVEHPPHQRARVRIELRLGDAGLLEVEDVEEPIAGHRAQHVGGLDRQAREERNAHADDGAEAIGRSCAPVHATIEPQSWPTRTACFSPSASSSPTMSPTRCRTV